MFGMQNIFYNLSVNSALSNVVKTERRKKKKTDWKTCKMNSISQQAIYWLLSSSDDL